MAKVPFGTFLVLKRTLQKSDWVPFRTKKVQNIAKRVLLTKKMVPSASTTFWEHSARIHLMVLDKIVKMFLETK